MHGEGLHLSAEDREALAGDNTPHVGHHRVREDLVDEAMVAEVAGVRHMLHTQPIIVVWEGREKETKIGREICNGMLSEGETGERE